MDWHGKRAILFNSYVRNCFLFTYIMSSSPVEKIKERLSIEEVVGSYIKLERAGSSLRAKCPFHHEKSPSFFVSPDRGTYYCFGCGVKGDVFTFVQEFEGLDFMGALKLLAERSGVTLEQQEFHPRDSKDKLYRVLDLVTQFYHTRLLQNEEAKVYLKNRGLIEKTVREWKLGLSGTGWRDCYDYLKSKNVSDADMEAVGLIKKNEKSYYDRFRDRIMFPLFDTSARVIGFSGRIIKAQDDTAKYINSPETVLFNKSAVLYGLHKAKTEIRVKNVTILVEGQLDLLMSHQAGFANTVATSGTALTADHIQIVKRYSPKLILAYDADGAGLRASEKAWQMAIAMGMEVSIASLPQGMDPADVILKEPALWEKALKESKHIIDFYLDVFHSQKLEARELALKIVKDVLPYVAALPTAVEKSHFISKIAAETSIREEALWEDVRKLEKVSPHTSITGQTPDKQNKKHSLERQLFGILYWQESLPDPQIKPEEIRGNLKRIVGQEQATALEEDCKEEKEELAFIAERYCSNSKFFTKDVEVLFMQLEIDSLKKQSEEYKRHLAIAEREKNKELEKEFLKKIQDNKRKQEELKKQINK